MNPYQIKYAATLRRLQTVDLNKLFSVLRSYFLAWALPIPVLLPMLFHLGRANGSILTVVYLAWGLVALRAKDFREFRLLWSLYLLILVTFSLGIFGAIDPQIALEAYVKFAFSLLTVFFTILCLHEGQFKGDLPLWFGVAALGAIGIFSIRLGYYATQPNFIPAEQVSGAAAAVLLPLACVFFRDRFGKYKGNLVFLIICLLVPLALLFADSRTEVLMTLAGVGVLCGFYYRRLWTSLVVCLIGLPTVVAIDAILWNGLLSSDAVSTNAWDDSIRARLQLWRIPFDYPPENPWIGIGIKNARYFIAAAADPVPVKHLHNFMLEMWYETGWLGFLAFFGFCGVLLRKLPEAYRSLSGEKRLVFSAVLGSAVAVIIAASLDRGYTGELFRIYLMFCMAALFLWSHEDSKRL